MPHPPRPKPARRAPPARLMLVSPFAIVRESLRAWLERAGDRVVVAEAHHPAEALGALDRARPDAVLLVPGPAGPWQPAALARLCGAASAPRVVLLDDAASPTRVLALYRAGVTALLPAAATLAELADALRAALAGQRTFHEALAAMLVAEVAAGSATAAAPADLAASLSPRERDVAERLARGASVAAIAAAHGTTCHTVHAQRRRALAKLGLRTTGELVRFALRQGWAPLEP